jgi:LPS O-antigen subunit length determinant protein (WzzB/FepE family)
VRRVHSLERNALRGAVKVGVVDKVLDRLEDLLEDRALGQPGLKHRAKKLKGLRENKKFGYILARQIMARRLKKKSAPEAPDFDFLRTLFKPPL